MSNLRPSGLPLVQTISWGTHVCVFYRSPQDLMKLLVPYFKAGLMHHEYCVWVTSNDLQVTTARKAMRRALRKTDHIRLQSQMEIFSQSEWYLKHRNLDNDEIRKAWTKKVSHVGNWNKNKCDLRWRRIQLSGCGTAISSNQSLANAQEFLAVSGS